MKILHLRHHLDFHQTLNAELRSSCTPDLAHVNAGIVFTYFPGICVGFLVLASVDTYSLAAVLTTLLESWAHVFVDLTFMSLQPPLLSVVGALGETEADVKGRGTSSIFSFNTLLNEVPSPTSVLDRKSLEFEVDPSGAGFILASDKMELARAS